LIKIVRGDDDGRDVALLPLDSVVTVRLRTPEECRVAGLDWRDAPPVWSVVTGGTEHLIPVRYSIRFVPEPALHS
jgi:hypothetical protein